MEGLIEGRIVHYVLSQEDCLEIERRRIPFAGHGENWPKGAQAHVGNPVSAGEHVPAMVVKVWSDNGTCNLQVILDGNDSLWKTSVVPDLENPAPYTWHWIEKA